MMTLTWRVGELAETRGLSVRRLATKTGLDEKTVRNIVAGRATRVDLETIARLADALNVSPGALWRLDSARALAWQETAGAAGHASANELDDVLDGVQIAAPNGAVERALRLE